MESSSIFNICRLCLYKSERLINIFEVNGRHGYIAAEVITDLLQFKVCRSDGYPHFVCCPCLDKLTDFKIFKDQCVNSKITYENEFSMKKGEHSLLDSAVHVTKVIEEDETDEVEYVPIHIKHEMGSDGEDNVSQNCDETMKVEDDEEESDNAELEREEGMRPDITMARDLEGERIEVCPEVAHLTGHMNDSDTKSDMAVMDLRKPRTSSDSQSLYHRELALESPGTFQNEMSDDGYIQGQLLLKKNATIATNQSSKIGNSLLHQQQKIHARYVEGGETSADMQGSLQDEFYKRERPYECEECGWRFVNPTQLDKHLQIHSAEKPFECEECGWRFFNRGQLTRHQKSHNGEKPFVCEVCGKRFVRKSSLVTHHRIHTGEKPFSCEKCGSSFAQSGDLAKHARIHSGEKPFPCHECGKMFAQSSDLAKHFRVHSGEKPYACDECERRFASTCDLNRHKMGHRGDKPFVCEQCEKRFIRRSALVIHIRTHTGEKPYSCPECGKGFPQRSGLATHLRVHSGERPYPCLECDKRFNTSGDLKRHMNVHSK